MRLIRNAGTDRVIDNLQQNLETGASLDIATPAWSIFAFGELRERLAAIANARVAIPTQEDLQLLGGEADRPFRNRLQSRWLARLCREWIAAKTKIHTLHGALPQTALISNGTSPSQRRAITGPCALTMDGLGIVPGNRLTLIQCADSAEEWAVYQAWFDALWSSLPADSQAKDHLLDQLDAITTKQPPSLIYHQILRHVFGDQDGALDEDRVMKAATGIKETAVWKRLYRFQRDGVVGAIDKLERHNGCIIADSVGLGKTFEALAIIKYYELRNDRVLVLCPKRLRDNWLIYRANDRRNILASDRFNYDVLNHTDLSRDAGMSGDIDLAQLNWGNYDLVVIDESHNFRNREGKIYQAIRKYLERNDCKVVLLSATPYNKTYLDLGAQLRLFLPEQNDIGVRPEAMLREMGESVFALRNPNTPLNSLSAFEKSDEPDDWREIMRLFLVRRTRSFIIKNYATVDERDGRPFLTLPTGERMYFPIRQPVSVKFRSDPEDTADPCARLFRDDIVNIIDHLNLPRYGRSLYRKDSLPADLTASDLRILDDLSRAGKRMKGFCRTNLFKRLESSAHALLLSIHRHILRNYLEIHALENKLAIPIGQQDAKQLDTRMRDAGDGELDLEDGQEEPPPPGAVE